MIWTVAQPRAGYRAAGGLSLSPSDVMLPSCRLAVFQKAVLMVVRPVPGRTG